MDTLGRSKDLAFLKTDAGQFAKVGVASASLIGISTRPVRGDIHYHTSRDTVDNIDPAAVEAGLNLAAIFAIEKGAPAPAEDGRKGPKS